MRTFERFAWLTLGLIAAGLLLAGCAEAHGAAPRAVPAEQEAPDHRDDEAEEDGHDHGDEGHGDEAEEDGHEGHDHDAHAEDGEAVELTAEQRRRIGLETAVAGPGDIRRELAFPGEVALDPDRVAHVVPRASGIVREVRKTLGDTVEAGEVLAWIESAELAEAKLEFFAKEAEVGCCAIELPRAREIFDNVNRLADLLAKDPTPEQLHELDGLEMGEYRGRLVAAYTAFVAAMKAWERERGLRDRAISSGQELVAAETEYRRAHAEFDAGLDTARYEVYVALSEATKARQLAEFEAVAAEQKLRLKGVDEATIRELRALVPNSAGLKPCDCGDPECKEHEVPSLRRRLGEDRRFGWLPLTAPFSGVVIEKHLTLGERIDGEESVFEIADTSSVWVTFGVFQKDLSSVGPGQKATVEPTGGKASYAGRIGYLSPVLDPDSRTARGRLALVNPENRLRPGLFVNVRVELPTVAAAVVVPRSAVQILDEKEIVFIQEGDGFEAVPVVLGSGDRDTVEVTRGLKAGQRYVTRGAFELKAKIATRGMGAHAGHGH